MPPRAVHVEGVRELDRAFKLYGRGLEKGVPEVLEAAAEPVKFAAHGLALSAIKVSRVDWTEMRVGVTAHTSYVAPVRRGRNRNPKRWRGTKFKNRLLTRALEPALERNRARVIRELRDALNDLARAWGRL